MICWVATYPGCGSTLLCQMIHQLFGERVYFATTEFQELFTEESLYEMGNQYCKEKNWDDFYKLANESRDLYFIKTHKKPMDQNPAIVVVRDGRAAIESYYWYQKKTFPDQEISLMDVIFGNMYYKDWSYFYQHWTKGRPQTLSLNFESLKENPKECIERIEDFLGKKSKGDWADPFQRGAQSYPNIFRLGQIASWRETWSEEEEAIFWLCHGETMAAWGYEAPLSVVAQKAEGKESEYLRAAFKQVLATLRNCNSEKKQYQKQVNILNQACCERLELIEMLDRQLKQLQN